MRDGKQKSTVCTYSNISRFQMVRHFVATLVDKGNLLWPD